jgi:hypothetical protein
MMKFTLIRTNQQGREYVSTRTAALFLERVKSCGHVAHHEVYPCAELRRQADGTTVVRRLNGIVVLTVGPLASEAEVLAIKQAAAMLPTTVAALRSGDGLTVKVLVSYALKTAATAEDETVANVAATTAYEQATMVYSRALGHSISPEEPSVRMHFTAAADAEAFPREHCRGVAAVQAQVQQNAPASAWGLGATIIPFWPALPVDETWTYTLSARIFCDGTLVKRVEFTEESRVQAFWYGMMRSDLLNEASSEMHKKLVQRLSFELRNRQADLNSASDY